MRAGPCAGETFSYIPGPPASFRNHWSANRIISVEFLKFSFSLMRFLKELTVGKATPFSAKLKRTTRATRTMLWMWTGEVTADRQGYRVLATGQQGSFQPPPGLAAYYPAILLVRVYGINGYGTVYLLAKGYQLNQ